MTLISSGALVPLVQGVTKPVITHAGIVAVERFNAIRPPGVKLDAADCGAARVFLNVSAGTRVNACALNLHADVLAHRQLAKEKEEVS